MKNNKEHLPTCLKSHPAAAPRNKPYERLSLFYDKAWGGFCFNYIGLLDNVRQKHGFNPSSVLDIACGTGSLAGEFNRRGLRAAGSDISPSMLRAASAKHPGIPFEVCDMAKLDRPDTFDLIVCPFDSFNYLLTDAEISATLEGVRRHLNRDGLFLFDIVTPSLYENKHQGAIERNIEGASFRQILCYENDNRLASTVFMFSGDECEEHLQKAYSMQEIAGHLVLQGFTVLNTAKDRHLEDADALSERVFFVARKS